MIHVSSIKTRAFMGHRELKLELPSSGVVVVTGPNGAGKSSLVEAVAAALWGKTLRGTPWWTDGVIAHLRVETDRVNVVRDRDGRKLNSVSWGLSTTHLTDYDTASKAQAELDPIVGAFSTWRRSAVFSSQDLLSFSLATDAERKRLLEGMLGLDVFDRGLVACRAEISVLKKRASEIERKIARATAKLEVEQKRLADADEALGAEPPTVDAGVLDRTARSVKDAQAEHRAARDTSVATRSLMSTQKVQRDSAERKLAELAGMVECPECGQPLSDEARERLGAGARAKVRAADAKIRGCVESHAAAEIAMEEIGEELAILSERLEGLRSRSAARQEWERARSRRNVKSDEVQHVVECLEADLKGLGHEVTTAQNELVELAAVERVLGLRGVRAHVVSRAVRGLESVANAWLDRLLPGVSLRLRGCEAYFKGSGTTQSDTIELEVQGLSHGGAYRACSGGERRRVDVALLLALAEIQAAAAGATPGTCFFDEVFDVLDADGCAAVGEALREISAERCVLVVTHSDELAGALDPVARVAMSDGRVES